MKSSNGESAAGVEEEEEDEDIPSFVSCFVFLKKKGPKNCFHGSLCKWHGSWGVRESPHSSCAGWESERIESGGGEPLCFLQEKFLPALGPFPFVPRLPSKHFCHLPRDRANR